MKKRLSLILLCMVATIAAWAQTVITGTVVSAADGEPLIGASVKVKGEKTGSVTDLNGKFKINAEAGKTLVFSYIAMEAVERPAKNGMYVEMTSLEETMDEVMVVAYGTQKKSSFTGSAVEIKSDDIAGHVSATATSALVGKVAGIQATTGDGGPGSGPSIKIRGIGSLSATSSPLYIVDGAPYENGIATINPNDIASISVLKDAAASAIYGARGANGVIIITTKRAQAGEDPAINFEARWGSNSRLVPQYDVISNPAEYYETHYRALYNSKIYHGSTSAEAYAFADAAIFDVNNGGLGYQVFTVPEGQKFIGTNFKVNPNATLGYTDGTYYYTPDNWYDEVYHSSFRQEYNLSASGATDRFNYYANLGYLGDGGFVDKSSYNRYTARLNGDYKIKSWLTFSAQMGFTHGISQTPQYSAGSQSTGNMFHTCNNMAPIYPLYVRDAKGNIMEENGRVVYDANQTNFKRPTLLGNPVRDNVYNDYRSVSDLFNGRWGLTATPVKGLTLSASLNLSSYNSRANYLYSPFGSSSSTDGAVQVSSTRRFSLNQNYLARYETTFAKDHTLNVMLGYEQYKLTKSSLAAYNDHLYNPFIAELGNAHGTSKKDLSSSSEHYMTQGFFSQLQYDYKETYFLSGSYRRDASSCFAPGHRWGNFGSVGAAWQITKMNFMKDAKWVNFLKLKLSYGIQGNDGVGYYTWADRYQASYNEETKEYNLNMQAKGNENLTWESSNSWNLGLDFALFNHHLNGSVEFYHRATSNMLYFRSLPLSSGISASGYYDNVGSMYNRGVEVTLNANIFRTNDFKWDVDLNLTHNTNKITDLGGDTIRGGYQIIYEGGSASQAYMLKYAGTDKTDGRAMYYKDVLDEKGNIKEQTTTYDITEATMYDCGTTLPVLVGGFGTSLSYKGFELSAQFSYSLGGKMYDGAYQSLMHNGRSAGSAMHRDLLNAWSPENPNSDIPRLSTAAIDDPGVGSQASIDRFMVSSDYLSLNNLTLGYSFPKKWLSRAKISNLRIYVAGENLFLLTARKGLDPRFNNGLGSMMYGSGEASSSYSGSRTITAGVSLKF
ncbi:MAG: TonB-dependent receptor [Bacteroidaceae bacterium]|nr:TonB-dependent receptor [Bacteroidaceae bacterium]